MTAPVEALSPAQLFHVDCAASWLVAQGMHSSNLAAGVTEREAGASRAGVVLLLGLLHSMADGVIVRDPDVLLGRGAEALRAHLAGHHGSDPSFRIEFPS